MTDYVDTIALTRPVPDMSTMRDKKQDYYALPIDTHMPLSDEPLVALGDYGVAGAAYYSLPNNATGKPVPGVDSTIYLRRSTAITLATLNTLLRHEAIAQLFGEPVELLVKEGLRPVSLQKRLYDDVFPQLIREQNKGISDDDMVEKRRDLIAEPSDDPLQPSPHATGGAFDLSLQYIETGEPVDFGNGGADVSERAFPDYYESHDENAEAQACRRAFFAIMTGAAFGIDTGFVCNPTEWWHWGRGDQLSETVRGAQPAWYAAAEQAGP